MISSRFIPPSLFYYLLIVLCLSGCVELNVFAPTPKNDDQTPDEKKGFYTVTQVRMKVSTAGDIPLLPEDVDKILADANEVAIRKDGTVDIGCAVEFTRENGIEKFDSPQIIRDRFDLKDLNDKYSGLKVVKEIRWCENFWPDILGCQKDAGIVVVRAHPSQEGILWLHEYGHLRGLRHRNQTHAVMDGFIRPTNKYLNNTECARYR